MAKRMKRAATSRLSRKKRGPIKASYGCETADDSQAAHRYEAPYKREGTVGCESANGSKAFKLFQAKQE